MIPEPKMSRSEITRLNGFMNLTSWVDYYVKRGFSGPMSARNPEYVLCLNDPQEPNILLV